MPPIQTINLDELLRNPDDLPWVAHSSHGRSGSEIHELYRCEHSGQMVALVRSKPGAFAAPHRHGGHETIYVLRGSFTDDYGVHVQGDLVHYPPGSSHAWRSPEGGIMYVVWGGPVSQNEPMETAQ